MAKRGPKKTPNESKGRRQLAGDGTSVEYMVIRNRESPVYTRTETTEVVAFSASTTTPAAGAIVFTLSLLPGYTTLQALFDRYRIMSVDVHFQPYLNQVATGTPATLPRLHTAIDYDDESVPTSQVEMEKYGTYAGVIVNHPLRRHFVPRASLQVFNGVSSGYGESEPHRWLDCAYAAIPHYGIKYYLPITSTANTYAYIVHVTSVVQFAGAR
jgi:hypothetical protein